MNWVIIDYYYDAHFIDFAALKFLKQIVMDRLLDG